MATLPPDEMQYQLDHASDDRRANLIASVTVCLFLAHLAVALRIFSRKVMKTPLGADDWMILVALFFNTVYATSNYLCVRFGIGRHAILVKDPVAATKITIATEALYNPAMITVKFSILLLYHRIFQNQKFKYVLWAVAVFTLCYTTAGTFVVIFQCVPIRATWDPTIKHFCVDLQAELIALGVLNSLNDFIILALPIPSLYRLHSSLAHKLQLAGMFALGGFVCITSITRVIAVSSISLLDGTWVNTYPAIWAFVETSIAVVSACLPTLRPVYKLIIYGKQGLSRNSGSQSEESKAIKLTPSAESYQRQQKAGWGRMPV